MRQISLLILFLTFILPVTAQEFPQFNRGQINYCDSVLSDQQVMQLREELKELEDYFIRKGLLQDETGTSYRAVYERIANEDDLNFKIDTSFQLLDSPEFKVFKNCIYKLLTDEQLSSLTVRHLRAAERITQKYSGDISPGIVAQRIIDNLTADDFNLQFYKVSSLIAFYKIAYSSSLLLMKPPDSYLNTSSGLKTIKVRLNNKDQIRIEGNLLTIDEAKQKIYQFLRSEASEKGVEIVSDRGSSYQAYINLLDMLDAVYLKLNAELGETPKNIIIKALE